jgi:1,5-anhydro-D-fructose reductase (1,5-anhydro-D-mannitol-forming)
MTDLPLRLGVIGLGAMGAEMLAIAAAHPDVAVELAADPSAPAIERARIANPAVQFTDDPMSVITHTAIDAVYIAAPPTTHARYAIAAMQSGKAVFCEKPLAVDLTEGKEMVNVATSTGLVNALNYTLSDRSAAVEVLRAVRAGEAGDIRSVDIQFLFPEWPREFQKEARWVAGREQGGFLREVGSHFVFLTDLVVGELTPVHTQVSYGEDGETSATGLFTANGIPVRLTGNVAAGPEHYSWTLYGSRRSYRITAWGDLSIGDSGGWKPVTLTGPRGGEDTRLAEFVGAVRGRPSTLADFAAGLRVQRAIEAFHTAA